MVLIARLEFTPRASLLYPNYVNKYIPIVKICPMTGIVRWRFDSIWSEIWWGDQPNESLENMSHA